MKSILAALIIVEAAISSATTIVVIRTPQHIVVGSDSLIVNWSSGPANSHSYNCKVKKQGATFFAMEGMGLVHFKSGFSVEELARHAIRSSSSMQQAAADFARHAAEPYARVITAMKKEYPKGWKLISQYGSHAIPLIVVFFGIENGISKYVLVGFRVSGVKPITILTDTASCPGRACQGHSNSKYGVIIGESAMAYRRMGGKDQASFIRFQSQRSDVNMAHFLIAMEEESAREVVGGPINVVTVDAPGASWSTPSGTCQF